MVSAAAETGRSPVQHVRTGEQRLLRAPLPLAPLESLPEFVHARLEAEDSCTRASSPKYTLVQGA